MLRETKFVSVTTEKAQYLDLEKMAAAAMSVDKWLESLFGPAALSGAAGQCSLYISILENAEEQCEDGRKLFPNSLISLWVGLSALDVQADAFPGVLPQADIVRAFGAFALTLE